MEPQKSRLNTAAIGKQAFEKLSKEKRTPRKWVLYFIYLSMTML